MCFGTEASDVTLWTQFLIHKSIYPVLVIMISKALKTKGALPLLLLMVLVQKLI